MDSEVTSQLLKLSPKKFSKLFLETITSKALKEESDTCYYSLSSSAKGDFFGVNLDNLVFRAENSYELWLLVYEYILKNSKGYGKVLVFYTNKTRCMQTNEIMSNDKYDMSNFDKEDIEDMINEASGNTIEEAMETIVDNVVDDLFKNDTLWVREINFEDDDDEEEEDEEDEEDEVEEEDE